MDEIENISYALEEEQVRRAAQEIARELEAEVEKGQKLAAATIIISLAALVDFWELIATISFIQVFLDAAIIGWVIELTPPFFLYFFMKQQGWLQEVRTNQKSNNRQLKIIFWILSFVDIIPFVEVLPLQTYSVFKVWRAIKKRAEEAKIELEELQFTTQQEVERIREIQLEIEEQTKETAPKENTEEKSTIIEDETGTEEPSEFLDTPEPTETTEEVFIPQEVRDPLGKLKKEYFETPSDETLQKNSEDEPFKQAA